MKVLPRRVRWGAYLSLMCLLSFAFPVFSQSQVQVTDIATDFEPPVIDHTPSAQSTTAGEPYTLTVLATDDSAVKEVILHYKLATEQEYRTSVMQARDANRYEALLPATDVVAPQIEYFIQAVDEAGNAVFRGAQFSPLILQVAAPSLALGPASNNSTTVDRARGDAPVVAVVSDAAEPANKPIWKWVVGGLLVGILLLIKEPPPPQPTNTGTVTIQSPTP